MKNSLFTVIENKPISRDVFRLALSGDCSAITAPGQFVNVALPGLFLRRPISVCDVENGVLTLVYKVVGTGTDAMSALLPGDELDLLTGLGNGFDVSSSGGRVILAGGGVGAPPLYLLAKRLLAAGRDVTAALGFGTAEEVILADEFSSLGVKTLVTTIDGSFGEKGLVTSVIEPEKYDCMYACGPIPMLKSLYNGFDLPGAFSLEERMGCGFGACMGCSIQTLSGPKRVCKEGPVFDRKELLWQTQE